MSEPKSKDSESSRAFKRRAPKPYWDKKWLQREYITKQRSASEIAGEYGTAESSILYFLAKHGIQRRTMSDIRKAKKWGQSGKANGMYGRCGSKNPRWIDGSSPERQRMYARSFWKELIKAVFERDEYRCRRCNAEHTGKNRLHAHHVKPWAGNESSRFSLANIITLCNTCHNWVHSKRNTRSEYLSS